MVDVGDDGDVPDVLAKRHPRRVAAGGTATGERAAILCVTGASICAPR
jgi:hypothetical protein